MNDSALDLFNEQAEIELQERARRGLLAFTLYTNQKYHVGWHHKALCRKLNLFAQGKIKRLMVFMPPRHGKSELVSRRLPAFLLGRDPSTQIIAASHTVGLASKMNRDVQRIMDLASYSRLFPKTKLPGPNVVKIDTGTYLRNATEFETIDFRGSYKCAGVGGGISGFGGNFLLLDDPIKDSEEAESPVYREKLWDWYNSTFDSRGEKDYSVLITLTRWHEDDLAGRLLKKAKEEPEADQWDIINFPAIREAGEAHDDPRKEGEALWSWKYPLESLKKKKATGGSRSFNSIYQQRPSSEQGEIIKRAWTKNRFDVLPELNSRGRWDQILVSSDMRFKKDKKSGDYVVHQAWGRLGARIYFLGEHRGRWGFTDSIAEFLKIIAKTPVGSYRLSGLDKKLIENKANGPAMEEVLDKKVSGMVLVEPDGGKVARVHAVEALWEAGNVWLPSNTLYPEIDDIIEEFVSFGPGCAFDDRTDTMSMALVQLGRELNNGLEDLVKW